MRFHFLVMILVVGTALSSLAAEPVIIINPDGSFTVDGKAQEVQSRPAPEPAVAPKKKVHKTPEPVAETKPEPEPAAVVEEKSVPVVESAPESAKAEVAPPAPEVKPTKKPVKKDTVKKRVPKATAVTPAPAPQPGIARDVPDVPVGPITMDDAKRIALQIGPPARSVNVYPADYLGQKVFQVIFKTEDGEEFVLIDRVTGEIVKEKKPGKKKKKQKD